MQTTMYEPPAAIRRWRASPHFRWATRGAWAVFDQGMFAGSNFLMTVLLARWLAPHEFGAFTVAYSVFLLAGTIHTALITEPLLVFGSGKYGGSFRAYLSALLRGHWLLSSAAATCMGVGAITCLLLGSTALGRALGALALATPFVLFSWLARRACVARLELRRSAIAGGIYVMLMLIGLVGLRQADSLSPATAFGVLGGASIVAGMWMFWRLGVPNSAVNVADTIRDAKRDHWRYGRWSLATGALSWVPGNILVILLPAVAGLSASGVVKALTNLALPMMHANTAFGMLLLPAFMRARTQHRFRSSLVTAGCVLGGGSLVYGALVGVFAEPLLHLLYGGQYTQYGSLVWLVAILPVTAALVAVLGSGLRVLERPDRIFWASVGSTVICMTAGLFALLRWAAAGVFVGQVMGGVATCAFLAFFVLREQRAISTAVIEVSR